MFVLFTKLPRRIATPTCAYRARNLDLHLRCAHTGENRAQVFKSVLLQQKLFSSVGRSRPNQNYIYWNPTFESNSHMSKHLVTAVKEILLNGQKDRKRSQFRGGQLSDRTDQAERERSRESETKDSDMAPTAPLNNLRMMLMVL